MTTPHLHPADPTKSCATGFTSPPSQASVLGATRRRSFTASAPPLGDVVIVGLAAFASDLTSTLPISPQPRPERVCGVVFRSLIGGEGNCQTLAQATMFCFDTCMCYAMRCPRSTSTASVDNPSLSRWRVHHTDTYALLVTDPVLVDGPTPTRRLHRTRCLHAGALPTLRPALHHFLCHITTALCP